MHRFEGLCNCISRLTSLSIATFQVNIIEFFCVFYLNWFEPRRTLFKQLFQLMSIFMFGQVLDACLIFLGL